MKKFLATILAAGLILSLSACSGGNAGQNSSSEIPSSAPVSSENKESASENTLQSSSTEIGGTYASMEEYVESPVIKDTIDSLLETMESMGMNIEVKGDGNKLIYEYTFLQQMDADTVKESLETSLESQATTMESVAKSLIGVVEVDTPVVVVRYLNADGSELYSREFTAN